ncbi:MAG: DUF6017 domain-containing protein [Saccharofermentanales bacterium]
MTNLIVKSTGNKTVDKMAKIEFSGNVIPHTWFKTLMKENSKPNLNAMILLSDIVYWYRPTEIMDEKTNSFIGYAKKFKGDILQRSYQQIQDKFGLSKNQARDAIVFLEEKGVIKRIFRTITVEELKLGNVMFIDLDFERLMEITFPEIEDEKQENYYVDGEDTSESGESTDSEVAAGQTELIERFPAANESKTNKPAVNIPISNESNSYSEISYKGGVQKFPNRVIGNFRTGSSEISDDKYIDYNTKITNIDYNLSILSGNDEKNDRLEMIENLRQDYFNYFEKKLELDILRINYAHDAEKINNIRDLMIDICLQNNCQININGFPTSVELVKSRFMKLKTQHIEYILETLKKNTTKVKNIRSYLLTTIYNAPTTYEHYYDAEFNYYYNNCPTNENNSD